MPVMDNTPVSEPVQMDNLKALLEILHIELSRKVTETSQVSQDQVQSGLLRTFEELEALKAEVKATKAIVEGLTTFHNKTASKETETEFIEVVQTSDHSSAVQELEASQKQLSDSYATLNTKHQSLVIQNQNLTQEHQIQLDNVSTKLDESERRGKALRIQVGRLQAHLTKNATNANELIDSEVKAKLEMIQARTQTLVGKFCFGEPKNPSREVGEFAELDNEWVKKFNGIKNRLSQEDLDEFRRYWIRSKVYMLLEKRIFNQQVFGLEPDLEGSLAEFERIAAKQNRDDDISDWRALTLRYSTSLGMKNSELAEKTAKYMRALFLPWVLGNPAHTTYSKGVLTYTYPAELMSDLTELCQAAYDLTVMLRRSTDKYTFTNIEEGTEVLSQEEDLFQVQDMIGQKSKLVGSRVWVNLFGALVKETRTDERYVMMKALVICKVRPPLLRERSTSPKKGQELVPVSIITA